MRAHPFECIDLKFYFSYFSGEDYLSLGANVGRAERPMRQNPEHRVEAGTKRIPVHQLIWCKKASCLLALGAAVAVLFSTPVQPVELEKGDFSLALDTTLSYGLELDAVEDVDDWLDPGVGRWRIRS